MNKYPTVQERQFEAEYLQVRHFEEHESQLSEVSFPKVPDGQN